MIYSHLCTEHAVSWYYYVRINDYINITMPLGPLGRPSIPQEVLLWWEGDKFDSKGECLGPE